MPRRTTLKDVAAQAGVSASTVCRALGSSPKIPDCTRARIRKIATSLGYRPDPLLSALAKQRHGGTAGSDIRTIAYITNFPTSDFWHGHTFYDPVFKGAQAHAARHGYKLEHFWLGEPGMTPHRLGRILTNRGIQAVCIAPTPIARSHMEFDWDRFSGVTLGYSLQKPDLHRTAPHHFHGILTATQKLHALGYERIGLCIFAGSSKRVDDLWLAGALLAEQTHPGLTLKVFLFDNSSAQQISAWAKNNHFDVIISDNADVMTELQRHGISVPGDIDYATLNWTPTETRIAGIDQRPAAIGAGAVDLVIAQLNRGERGIPLLPATTLIEGTWINGPSIRKKKSLTKSLTSL